MNSWYTGVRGKTDRQQSSPFMKDQSLSELIIYWRISSVLDILDAGTRSQPKQSNKSNPEEHWKNAAMPSNGGTVLLWESYKNNIKLNHNTLLMDSGQIAPTFLTIALKWRYLWHIKSWTKSQSKHLVLNKYLKAKQMSWFTVRHPTIL